MSSRQRLLVALLAGVALGGPVQAKDETAAPKPAPEKPGPTTAGGVPAEVLDQSAVQAIIGRSVKSPAGEDMGRIVDFLVSPAGQVRAAVLDFGGVLGVGSRRVAVGWTALSFSNIGKDGPVEIKLTRNQIRMAPEMKSGDPIVVLEPAPEEVPKGGAVKGSAPGMPPRAAVVKSSPDTARSAVDQGQPRPSAPAAPPPSGAASPGTTAPGTTAPGTTAPGTTAPESGAGSVPQGQPR